MTAARLLLAGRGVGEVAAALGVERHSVTRWKRDPAFRAALERLAAGAAITLPPGPPSPTPAAPTAAPRPRP